MNWKKEISTKEASQMKTLSFSGGGKVSVSVASIVNSQKVQNQVAAVKEIAMSQLAQKNK